MLPPEISRRLQSLDRNYSYLRGMAESSNSRVLELEKQIATLDIEVVKWDKVGKILSQLVEDMVKKDLKDIDNLVTYGLKVVFPDRNITFQSSMVHHNGKMHVKFTTLDNGKPVAEDAYGSVSVIESLILRIICILKTGVGKMLLLDETFSALDWDYIQRVGILLKELSLKTGIHILFVTFNANSADADHVLRAKLNIKTRELSITESKGGSDA